MIKDEERIKPLVMGIVRSNEAKGEGGKNDNDTNASNQNPD